MPSTPEFMLVSEAAKCLGVTAGTVRNWVTAGRLRAKRHPVNGYRMLLKADIDALARDIHALPAALKKPLPFKKGRS
jgi:excisionase family DNA binding protein